jgi:hypothetical protein
MSTPIVFPPPGPALGAYPLSDLNLFQANAPFVPFTPYDGTKPTKLWIDPAAVAAVAAGDPAQVMSYGAYNPATGEWETFTYTAAAAAATNVPGPQTTPPSPMFMPYTPQATLATWVSTVGFNIIAVQPGDLSTMPQALALAQSWGMTAAQAQAACVVVTSMDNATFTSNGETRQVIVINWNGLQVNVGQELLLQYANGIGAGGSWVGINTTQGQQPTWQGVGPYTYPVPNSAGPIPQIQAPAGYTIAATGLGQYAVVPTSVPATGGGGGLTPAQAIIQQQTLDGVNTLLAMFGKPPAS